MTLHLPEDLEAAVARIAARRGRDPSVVVEEAVRMYIRASAVTDVSAADVGATQEQLLAELSAIEPWTSDPDGGDAPR